MPSAHQTLCKAALTLCMALALQAAAAAGPSSLLGRNLVVNGNAEAAQGLPRMVGAQNWATTGHFTAVNYGYDDYPTSKSPGPADRGNRFFSGGTNDALSTASQGIDVSSLAAAIDAGKIAYDFSAWIGGFANQNDYATVTATFFNASHARLTSVQLGPVTRTNRQGLTALLRRQTAGSVPAMTRRIGIEIVSTRLEGASNDGYADNISLVLSQR
jgi:hypothetical protein